jgi:hypothetical protein
MLKITNIDKIQKKLEEMKSPEFMRNQMVEIICKKVPAAASYKDKFKIKRMPNGKLELTAEGLPASLNEEIKKAMGQK